MAVVIEADAVFDGQTTVGLPGVVKVKREGLVSHIADRRGVVLCVTGGEPHEEVGRGVVGGTNGIVREDVLAQSSAKTVAADRAVG